MKQHSYMSSGKKQCPPRCGSQVVDQRKKSRANGNHSSSIASRYNCMSSGGISKKSNKSKKAKQRRGRKNNNSSIVYPDNNTRNQYQSNNHSRNSRSINNNSNHLSHSRRSQKPNLTTTLPISTPSK
jgi:hypothetical protein